MRFQLLLVGALALSPFAVPAQKYDHMFVVGDSLPDNGNLFRLTGTPGAPYWMGRFSNGIVCSEQLSKTLEIPATNVINVALGGATTTDVYNKQVKPALLKMSGKLPAKTLCFYWAGANDLIALLSNPNGRPSVVIGNAMNQTASSLVAMHFAGAAKIVIVNMPNLAKTPRVIALDDPIASAGAAALSQAYNQALAGTAAWLASAYGVQVTIVDSFALMNDIARDPMRRMFLVVDKPILRPDGRTRNPERGYLFFDDIHPSYTGHREVMRTVLLALGRKIPGDANGDEVVNVHDVAVLATSFGPCAAGDPRDLDRDGYVGQDDLELLLVELRGR